MIGIINLGINNLYSVERDVARVGAEHELADPARLDRYRRIILPGVGAYGAAMQAIRDQHLDTRIKDYVADGGWIFGICLGMQLLFDFSVEGGEQVGGLGLIGGSVGRLPEDNRNRLPHIGWNTVKVTRDSPIFRDVAAEEYFYFQHSYAVRPKDDDVVIATSTHVTDFPCAVQHGNIFGVQFHPEKSFANGLALLHAFLETEGPAPATGIRTPRETNTADV